MEVTVKVKQLKPRLQGLAPRVAILKTDHDTRRRQQQAWRKWYYTARWKRLRWQCLERDLFTCQLCGRIEPEASKLVADHKVRHLGDPAKFWNLGNLQCLCKPCHDGAKQRAEYRDTVARRVGGL